MKIDTFKKNRLKIKERINNRNIRNIDKNQISVFKSNLYTYAILMDPKGNIITSLSTKGIKAKKTEAAFEIGEKIAKIAIDKKIADNLYFNRNGYLYHGRVKAVAEGARKSGIKF